MTCCHCVNRREFLGTTAALAAGAALLPNVLAQAASQEWPREWWDPDRPYELHTKPLRIQPVLMYRLPQRREMASWKSWGGVQTEDAVNEEAARIAEELKTLAGRAGFPIEILPVMKVTSKDEARTASQSKDALIIAYPATGSGEMLQACFPAWGGIVFVRHRSGPVYYWYEALSTELLRKEGEPLSGDKPLSVSDVVVDDPDELLWRLRAWHARENFLGRRIVALGGAAGKYAHEAPNFARERHALDIVEVSYDDLGKRIQAAMQDSACLERAEAWTDRYLAIPGTKSQTERSFVVNSFILYGLFKEILREQDASVFTIQGCMGTILPMSKTTACLTLSLLNDEGWVAFCESDFVIIPAGLLLHCVTGKPVFMHNSTFPHQGIVTCAHCTGPRRMDGDRYEPATLLTHYESEYGAAPKVDMPIGQEVTFINPEYATGRWLGMKGTVESNPFFEICRSQQDVRIHGAWRKLLNEVRDSHWMMAYGDHLQAIGYIAPRIGVAWESLPEA